jgi:AmmeMemoRadiSam system protein B
LVGGIVPHAGWFFSGAIACRVIEALNSEDPPDVIAIFGMHLHPGSPIYLLAEGGWTTPLGPLYVDEDLADAVANRGGVPKLNAAAFPGDNTIELQLPFIRHFFGQTRILPMGVPPNAQALTVARLLVDCANQLARRLLIIGSTDLTHYGANYNFTSQGRGQAALNWVRDENDRRIIESMQVMDAERVIDEALQRQNACCAGAAAAALEAGKALGADVAHVLNYATSYDKHPSDSFVGYVGMVF